MSRKRISRETVDSLKSMLTGMITGIVDHPDEVEVTIVPGSYRILAELHTNPDDVGQVIGGRGFVVEAVRSMLAAFGGKNHVKVDLEYVTEQEYPSKRERIAARGEQTP